MIETTVTTDPDKDTLEFELTATLPGGVHVPIEVVLVYPKGHGLHAVQALAKAMETQTAGMFNELLNRQDASLVQAVLANGQVLEDDDDEW